MDVLLQRLAHQLWPDFDALDERDRSRLLAELATSLLSLPLVALSLGWLIEATDFSLVRTQWPALLLILVLGYTFSQVSFFQVISTRSGEFSFNSTNLGSILLVSTLLLLGPLAIWPYVFLTVSYRITQQRHLSRVLRWNWLRNLLHNLWSTTLSSLVALSVYRTLGGSIPLADLSLKTVGPAFVAVTVLIALNSLFLWGLFIVQTRLLPRLQGRPGIEGFRESVGFFLLSEIPAYFGIMAAGLYTQIGVGAFSFFMAGVVMVSLLARRLSQAAMMGQQRSREADLLEQLGRAVIDGPPDASTFPTLLAEYVPRMVPFRQAGIHLFGGQQLLNLPADSPSLPEALWSWLHAHPTHHVFEPDHPLPWAEKAQPYRYLLSPILSPDQGSPVGGICLIQDANYALTTPVDLQPSMQALAAQVSSTLRSAEAFRKTLEHQKMAQELAFAGQIQASFLPTELPRLDGWQLVAALQPARETSGDFYDAFPLPNGKLGLLVADVSDKGMGAALYMALARTLLRTYAFEYHTRPDYVLRVANRRILTDTQAGLFVSVFYAVVDPFTSTLTYANAGHCPAFHLQSRMGGATESLKRTGMVLGVMEGVDWGQVSVPMGPGDKLVLYSDGVTDAQNAQDEFFGEERLRACIDSGISLSAQELLDMILASLRQFIGGAPRFDDITLMVLERKSLP